MNMNPTEGAAQESTGSLKDLLSEIKSKVEELEARISQEETPEGEAAEHGGNPEDYKAIMEGQGTEGTPVEEAGETAGQEQTVPSAPYKKKPTGNMMKFLNGEK